MKRHAFRWDAAVFGLFFLAVIGQWAVWEHDVLSPDDVAYLAAGVLIVLGLVGIVATVVSARSDRRTAPFTPSTTTDTTDQPTTTDQPATDEPAEDDTTPGGNPA